MVQQMNLLTFAVAFKLALPDYYCSSLQMLLFSVDRLLLMTCNQSDSAVNGTSLETTE